MSEALSAAETRQLVVDALVGAAVSHAGVDPVLLNRTLDWAKKLQRISKGGDGGASEIRSEGIALLDEAPEVDAFIAQARKEKWSETNTVVFSGPDNVIKVKSRRGKKPLLIAIKPNREIVKGDTSRSSYYGLAVTVARDIEGTDTTADEFQAPPGLSSLRDLARGGSADVAAIAAAAETMPDAFAAACRAGGIGDGLIGAINARLGQFPDIAADGAELESLGSTLSFAMVEIPEVNYIEPEKRPDPEPRQGNGAPPPAANGNTDGRDPRDPSAGGGQDEKIVDDAKAEAVFKGFAQGFLSVLSDALKGVDIVLAGGGSERDTAVMLLTEARRARTWTEDDFAEFLAKPHLNGLSPAIRDRIIAVVKPEVGKAIIAKPNPSGAAASGLVDYNMLKVFEGLSANTGVLIDVGDALRAEVISVTGDARDSEYAEARSAWSAGREAWTGFPLPGPWMAAALTIRTLAEVGATGSKTAAFQFLASRIIAGRITKSLKKTGKYDFGARMEEKARDYGLSGGNPLATRLAKHVDGWVHRTMDGALDKAINDVFDLVDVLFTPSEDL